MKKNLFALVALVAFVMFGMVSCGGGESESYDVTFYNASYDGYKDWGAPPVKIMPDGAIFFISSIGNV